ncbi:aminoacyl-tRNA hydrolase [Tissierella creatinophila]|uniref:Peptidyl-tRNA hydrolase n=1 Tax=Tissierella creatinophila DSM 6911 TaxID=1123403 RepID=A0A1U7M6V5_TISCR|nr:aminoacyl-tRNA hydrolase [Tissierella creatinophila]OLS03015.1 peptidyl-tRNA hydrolase [Tissierella creatinophila DSM 6911]
MYVVVGLGNPGKEYTNTRHNIGFNTIELLAKRNDIKLNKLKFKGVYGEGTIGSEKVLLVKPQTYMNNSGITVGEIVRFYKLPIENLIVIVDDIDIEFSSIRIKKKGSSGSHNGLKSIIYHLNDDNFPRVKIGIGKKHANEDLANFVLGNFSKEETSPIEEAVLRASEAVETIIKSDINKAMNSYNKK